MQENQVKSVDLDALDTPCDDIDTSLPKLRGEALYVLEIRKPQVVAPKKNADGRMLVFTLCTTKDEEGVDGKVIHKGGFGMKHRIVLTPTEDRDIQRVAQDIAAVIQATDLVGKGITPRMIINDPKIIDEKYVQVKTKIQPESNGFPEQVVVKLFVPVNKRS